MRKSRLNRDPLGLVAPVDINQCAARRYLMIEEMTRDGLRINNPAGDLEPGESPIAGAMREALEETACHFTPEALLGVYLGILSPIDRLGAIPRRCISGETHERNIIFQIRYC